MILGANEEAVSLARMLRTKPHLGYDVVGFCSAQEVIDLGVPWLGPLDAAPELVTLAEAKTAIFATTSLGLGEADRLVRRLHDAGIHIELSAAFRDLETSGHSGPRAFAKHLFDVSISGTALVVVAPLIAVCALLVKLTSPGAVLVHQIRVGQGGRTFRRHKLRTMVQDAEAMVVGRQEQNASDGPLFKLREDPRVTRVGKVMRRLWSMSFPSCGMSSRGT